jgi:DoxX-like protein
MQIAIAIATLAIVLALVFMGAGVAKLLADPQSLHVQDQLGVGGRLWSSIGLLEVAACLGLGVGLAVHALGVAASIVLALLMIGAIIAHIRAGDVGSAALPALLVVFAVTFTVLRITGAC